jgi:hypothetical protein
MSEHLTDNQWGTLISRIQRGKCTPFLGAGASRGFIETAAEVARKWAAQFEYPLRDNDDLPRVAQYLAIEVDQIEPKDIFAALCRDAKMPDFTDRSQIHRVLAELPLPVYITTNYDDFMFSALGQTKCQTAAGETRFKRPKLAYCGWNSFTRESLRTGPAKGRSTPPTTEEPLVYHLHGHHSVPQSMVLTEDDYLGFLAWMTGNPRVLPPPIVTALSGTSLLFVGYSHRDWTFRVLFRSLVERLTGAQGLRSVSVQLPPDGTTRKKRDKILSYLTRYYAAQNRIPMDVHWGDASEFVEKLRQKWEERL